MEELHRERYSYLYNNNKNQRRDELRKRIRTVELALTELSEWIKGTKLGADYTFAQLSEPIEDAISDTIIQLTKVDLRLTARDLALENYQRRKAERVDKELQLDGINQGIGHVKTGIAEDKSVE